MQPLNDVGNLALDTHDTLTLVQPERVLLATAAAEVPAPLVALSSSEYALEGKTCLINTLLKGGRSGQE